VGLDAALPVLYIYIVLSICIRIPAAVVYVSQKMVFFTVSLFLIFFTAWELIQLCLNCLFRGIEKCSVADPCSGAFLTPGSGIRDPLWIKNQDQDPDPG
jgi:hypothetical protein